MDSIVIIAAIILSAISLAHEIKWRCRIAHSSMISGRVIGYVSDGEDDHPEVELRNAERETFISQFGGSCNPRIGQEVQVMSDGIDHEIYSWQNRWLFTLVPLAFAASCIGLWLSME